MTKKFCAVLVLGLLFSFVNFSLDSTMGEQDETQADEIVKIVAGTTYTFPTRTPSKVSIGKPEVADIVNVTDTEITIAGKAAGTTTLVYTDLFGEQSATIKVLAEDVQAYKDRVDSLLKNLQFPKVRTETAEDESKVLLVGTVKEQADKDKIELALGTLKAKVVDLIEVKEEEAAVEIEVQILELDKDATKTLGFTWPSAVNISEVAGTTAPLTATGTNFASIFRLGNVYRYAGAPGSLTPDPFALKIDALVQEGKARVLSRPRLSCQSGKEAEMLVGGEKPTFTTSVQTGGSSSTSVDYKEFGIKLKIKPTVTDDQRVKLSLNVEISEIGDAETIGSTGLGTTTTTALAYPLTKRNASTELYLNDGETMAMGGLIKQKTEEDLQKVPWLGDVPVLGAFFRRRATKEGGGSGNRGDTELFITLTPKIVRNTPAVAVQPAATQLIIAAPVAKLSAGAESTPNEPINIYAGIVQQRILERLVYPAAAKQAGYQGTVKLGLHISDNGKPLEVVLRNSSGYPVLDDSAVSLVKKINAFPPFPPSINSPDIWVDVPVVYKME